MEMRELLRRVGDPAQLYGIRDCRLSGGKAQGMRALRLYSAAGLSLTVLPDRGMDLLDLSFRGINLSFLSRTGPVHAAYFTEDGSRGFFRSFFAGFLTTGGLTYMGSPCVEDGQALGLHGLISNTPAQEVCARVEEGGPRPLLLVSGLVRQAEVFAHCLTLERRVEMDGLGSSFTLTDRIVNRGFEPAPFMLLYHINLGWPFLSPALRLHLPSLSVTPRDAEARAGLERHLEVEPPRDGAPEQVFFHRMERHEGQVRFGAENPDLDLSLTVSYPAEVLPSFTQWKCMRSGEYALGLEPGNCHVLGRAEARRDGSLRMLPPGGSVTVPLRVDIRHGGSEIWNI